MTIRQTETRRRFSSHFSITVYDFVTQGTRIKQIPALGCVCVRARVGVGTGNPSKFQWLVQPLREKKKEQEKNPTKNQFL